MAREALRSSRRASSTSAAKRLVPAARPTPAQIAPMSLRVFQTRSSSSRIVRARASSGVGREAERLLARLRVRDGVRDPAAGAGACDDRQAVRRAQGPRRPARGRGACRRGGRRRAGSGRRRRGSGSAPTRSRRRGSGRRRPGTASAPCTGRREPGEGDVVVDERPQRLVAVEADAVEVVRLPLVPPRRGGEVDDRRAPRRAAASARSRRASPSRRGEQRRHRGAALAAGGMQAREAPAVGERPRRRPRGMPRRR